MERLLEQLAELFEEDSVKETDVLEEFECWDSLTILSIIALGSEYGIELNNNTIRNFKTVGDLSKYIITNKK